MHSTLEKLSFLFLYLVNESSRTFQKFSLNLRMGMVKLYDLIVAKL